MQPGVAHLPGYLALEEQRALAARCKFAEWSRTLYGLRAGNVRWHLDVDPIEF